MTLPQSTLKRHRKLRWITLSITTTAVITIILLGYTPGRATATTGTKAAAVPSVAVVKVNRANLANDLRIPAEFRPYAQVDLHAKISGYLQKIAVDFGDRVKAGQLLATIEVPELNDELENAIATEHKAEADYTNAHLDYRRLLAVNKEHPNLVAQQDLDAVQSRDSDTGAAIAAAKADVDKYQALLAYTKITAPFDGVITRRYVDPGAMIQAGTSSDTQAEPVVQISNNYRLRLDFQVSVDHVKDIHVGDPVQFSVESLNGKTFTGKISRFSDEVDQSTRTMPVELVVDNPNLKLVPGMYATVTLKVERRRNVLAVPIEAVVAGNQPIVNVINARNEIEARPVTLGVETPYEYEVVSGLKEGDLVMVANPGQLKTGQRVVTKLVSLREGNKRA